MYLVMISTYLYANQPDLLHNHNANIAALYPTLIDN